MEPHHLQAMERVVPKVVGRWDRRPFPVERMELNQDCWDYGMEQIGRYRDRLVDRDIDGWLWTILNRHIRLRIGSYMSPAYVPPYRQGDYGDIHAAVSLNQCADILGMAMRDDGTRSEKLPSRNGELVQVERHTPERAALEGEAAAERAGWLGHVQFWLNRVADSIGPERRQVVERLYGLNGHQRMRPREIARQLGLPIRRVYRAQERFMAAARSCPQLQRLNGEQ